MSLFAVSPIHRMQLLERQVSTLVLLMKLRHSDDDDDLAALGCVWQAEVEEMHAAISARGMPYFDQREQRVSKRRDL